jgi:hypothetical protein
MEHKRSPIKVSQHKEKGSKTERGERRKVAIAERI